MTCIVGIAERGVVWMGGDSQATCGGTKMLIADGKVWEMGEFVVGVAGSARLSNLARHVFKPPRLTRPADLDAYMARDFCTAWLKCVRRQGRILKANDSEENHDGSVLVGLRGRLYQIGEDFSSIRLLESYCAIGSGQDLALGALHATEGQTPMKRIMLALSAAQKWDDAVSAPFHVKCVGEAEPELKGAKKRK